MTVVRKLFSKDTPSKVEVKTHDLTIKFPNEMSITVSSPNSFYTKMGIKRLNEIIYDVFNHILLTSENQNDLVEKYGNISISCAPDESSVKEAVFKLPRTLSFEEKQVKAENLDNAIVAGKYCIRYVYLQKQEDKTKAHPYWIFPKHYKSIIDEATYNKLRKHEAFLCQTRKNASSEKEAVIAIKLQVRPATQYDVDHFKELDLMKPVELDNDQKRAVYNFKDYVFRKQKEKYRKQRKNHKHNHLNKDSH
ncbi:hypothetical protein [Lactobacillus sp. HT06-2]|uniref:hypothetical protein n=1 Tax=Lactobacillus sp. HT06-2 TaxID=2080222 RepID=UPI000CD90107|nr:hypothetical protein [Lactobacillus sp. HT06-2]